MKEQHAEIKTLTDVEAMNLTLGFVRWMDDCRFLKNETKSLYHPYKDYYYNSTIVNPLERKYYTLEDLYRMYQEYKLTVQNASIKIA